jgi:hypothetical protein
MRLCRKIWCSQRGLTWQRPVLCWIIKATRSQTHTHALNSRPCPHPHSPTTRIHARKHARTRARTHTQIYNTFCASVLRYAYTACLVYCIKRNTTDMEVRTNTCWRLFYSVTGAKCSKVLKRYACALHAAEVLETRQCLQSNANERRCDLNFLFCRAGRGVHDGCDTRWCVVNATSSGMFEGNRIKLARDQNGVPAKSSRGKPTNATYAVTASFGHVEDCRCVVRVAVSYVGRDSSVGRVTRYGLDGPGIESQFTCSWVR